MTTAGAKPLTQGSNAATVALTNAAATYYTAPSSPDNIVVHVRMLMVCNVDAADHTFTVHSVASGGAVATSNAIFYAAKLKANQTAKFSFDRGEWVLTAGMTIQALADASNDVTITLGGEEEAP